MFLFTCYLARLLGKIKVQLFDIMAAKYVSGPEKAEKLILEAITKINSAKSKQPASSEKFAQHC